MDLDKAIEIATLVNGWLTAPEMSALFSLATQTPTTNSIVELGAWQGKSTIMLAAGSRSGKGAAIFSVDYFSTIPETGDAYTEHLPNCVDYMDIFKGNLAQAGVSAYVTPMRSNTASAGNSWSGPPVGLLFIDADHRYDSVYGDFLAWAPNCTEGALVAFHDYCEPAHAEVTQFVDQLLKSRILTNTTSIDSLIHGQLTLTSRERICELLRRYPRSNSRLKLALRSKQAQAYRLLRRLASSYFEH